MCAGTVDMNSSNVTLFFKGILFIDFKIPVGIFRGNFIFKGRFNYNIDIGITIAHFLMVFDAILN